VAKVTAPDFPKDDTDAVDSIMAPVQARPLPPDTTLTLPPIAESLVQPAEISREPPMPLSPAPTTTLMDPAVPPVAAPDPNTTYPELPPREAPDRSVSMPLGPEDATLAVNTATEPDPQLVLEPLDTTTEPPPTEPRPHPADKTMLPGVPPAALPATTLTVPL
jgi:hypothetical protein